MASFCTSTKFPFGTQMKVLRLFNTVNNFQLFFVFFLEIQNFFFSFLEHLWSNDLFFFCFKTENFEEERAHIWKEAKIHQKNTLLCYWNKRRRLWFSEKKRKKRRKKNQSTTEIEPATSSFLTMVTPKHLYRTRHRLFCSAISKVYASLANSGKGKKLRLRNWIFSFRKIWRWKTYTLIEQNNIRQQQTLETKNVPLRFFQSANY